MNPIPVVAVSAMLVTGLALQLFDIASSTSDKAVLFANSSGNAVDCAVKGIPISKCSPELFAQSDDIHEDLVAFHNLSAQLAQNLTGQQIDLPIGGAFAAQTKNTVVSVTLVSTDPTAGLARLIVIGESNPTHPTKMLTIRVWEQTGLDIDEDGQDDLEMQLSSSAENHVTLDISPINATVTPLSLSYALIGAGIIGALFLAIQAKKHAL